MTRNTIAKILLQMKDNKLEDYINICNACHAPQHHFSPQFWSQKEQEHTFTLKALLKPLAKKPPKGAIIDANKPRHRACH